jgi:hypothetical protein
VPASVVVLSQPKLSFFLPYRSLRMAQAATMGPPLSPREPRRSGRRSIPSTSTSASKSPDSDPAPKQKEISQRPPLASNNSSGRQKRLKQEDYDDPPDDHKNGSASSTPSGSSTHGTSNGRNKRKAKEIKQPADVVVNEGPPGTTGDPLPNAPEEEEQGITRCVCGSTGTFVQRRSSFSFHVHM